MRSIFNWNLRRKLVAVSLGVFVPLIVFGFYIVQENVASTKKETLSNSAATAALVAYQVDDLTLSTEKLLENLAILPAVRDRLDWESTVLFLNASVLLEDCKIIFAAREDGEVFAAGVTRGLLYDNIPDTEYLAAAVAAQRPTVSGRLPSTTGTGPVVDITVPIRNSSGEVIGLVGAGMSLRNLQQRLTNDQVLLQKATVMVVDSRGNILIHPDWRYVSQETSFARFPPVEAAMRTVDSGTIEYVDPHDGQRYLAAYAHAKATGWIVVVDYRADLAYSAANDATLRGLAGLGATATFAAVAILFFASRFTRPISKLSQKTRAMMSTLALSDQAAEPSASDEVRQIALAIDRMSTDLIRRNDELLRTKMEIEKRIQEMEDLSARALHMREEERKRLALEVHDGLAQFVQGALLQARFLKQYINPDQGPAMRRLQAAEELLSGASAEVNRMMFELRPGAIHEGLVASVQKNLSFLQEFFGLRCQTVVLGDRRDLPREVESTIYRVIREALHNVRKHAEASEIVVTFTYEPDLFTVTVADNGKGFDPKLATSETSRSLGLLGMRERAQELGATLELRSSPGCGTVVSLHLRTAHNHDQVASRAES